MPDTTVTVQDTPPAEVIEREVAYMYRDSNLGEPMPVYAARTGSWWMDGGVKLQTLLGRFKMHDTVIQACYITGITWEQYRHFKDMHPWFVPAIQVYKTLPAAKIKDVILEAAIGNEAKGIKPNAKMALGAYHIFEEKETDPDFVPVKDSLLPPGGSVATMKHEAFMDAEGNVVMKRKTAEFLQDTHVGNKYNT